MNITLSKSELAENLLSLKLYQWQKKWIDSDYKPEVNFCNRISGASTILMAEAVLQAQNPQQKICIIGSGQDALIVLKNIAMRFEYKQISDINESKRNLITFENGSYFDFITFKNAHSLKQLDKYDHVFVDYTHDPSSISQCLANFNRKTVGVCTF